MRLPFLDRGRELSRLKRAVARREGALLCVYGRRRLGKSRLVQRLLSGRRSAYYVGDARDAAVQRAAVAREMARLLPGFAAVGYPGWEELLDRWWREAPERAILVLDEFPALVAESAELPSLLQKRIDRGLPDGRHLILCGSSQRMMQGLLLEGGAPLYGRAQELLKLEPLGPAWLKRAFGLRDPADAVERYAVWGGVPRYWELALEHGDMWEALETLVLDPMGVLHGEPERLLLDDLRDTVRAASILSVIGQGANRLSEIGGRLGVPATSLSRPLARLLDLGLLHREVPFGVAPRDSKRSRYRIADPLLAFYHRFVEPNRSRLAAGQLRAVRQEIETRWPAYLGLRWEQMVRERIARRPVLGSEWQPAARWWGAGPDGKILELDVVSAAVGNPRRVLVAEAKLSCGHREAPTLLAELGRKAAGCPALAGKHIEPALWVLRRRGRMREPNVLGASDVVTALS